MQDISARQVEAGRKLCAPRRLGMSLTLHNPGAGEPQLDSRPGMDCIDNPIYPQGRDVTPPQAQVTFERPQSGSICNAALPLLFLQIVVLHL